MFVKILKSNVEEQLININEISVIDADIENDNYRVSMTNSDCFRIDKEQYKQLCEILTKRL